MSKEKRKLFVSPNVLNGQVSMLSRMLGFSLINNLGQYHGIPIFYERVNKDTYHYILKKVIHRLHDW